MNYPVENNSSIMRTFAPLTINTITGVATSAGLINATIRIEINMSISIQRAHLTRMNNVNVLEILFCKCVAKITSMVNWI